MKGREFDFSRLLLLVAAGFGTWAFFMPFYQIETFYARPSGFDITKQLIQYFGSEDFTGITADLLTYSFVQNPFYFIPAFILLIIPIILGIVAIELFIRSVVLKLSIVHRGWIFVIVSLVGIAAGYWLGYKQNDFEFYFFESVKSGYWQSLTMVLFSFFAKFSE